jgi:hypothetical protein
MRVRAVLIAILVIECSLISTVALAQSRAPIRRNPERIAGEYIVWLRDDMVTRLDVDRVARSMAAQARGEVLATFDKGLRGFGIRAAETDIDRLRDDRRVYRVEENAKMHLSTCDTFTDDTEFWHLDRIDQTSGIGGTNQYCWTSDGSGVDVYVVDTGIRSDHQEFFSGQVLTGVDFAGDDGHAPTDPCGCKTGCSWDANKLLNGGHGTAVAALIGGQELGVAKGSTLIPVKVAACKSEYQFGVELNLIGGIWATNWIMDEIEERENRAVINFSWFYLSNRVCTVPEPFCDPGTDPYQCEYNCAGSLEYNLSILLNDYNAVVVTSANNHNNYDPSLQAAADWCEGEITQSPARMGYGGSFDPNPGSNPNRRLVITVGGTDSDDERWVVNQENGSNSGSCVGIYAPADLIRAANITATNAYRNQSLWQQSSGTSWSSAIVSGVAARVLEAYPNKNPREVWDYIKSNATSLPQDFDGDGNDENDILVYLSPND